MKPVSKSQRDMNPFESFGGGKAYEDICYGEEKGPGVKNGEILQSEFVFTVLIVLFSLSVQFMKP